MEEKIISTESIYSGRVVKLVIHEVRLPDGGQAKRELVQHPGAVAMVALDHEQNVYLVRQWRVAAQKVIYEIPAGTLEAGELPADCAIRELQEEAGQKPGKLESLGGMYVAPGYTDEYIHLYLATDLTPAELDGDEDEFIEVERIALKEALAMLERGEIEDGKSIAALLRVARRLGV